MKFFVHSKINLLLLGFLAVILAGGGSVNADFNFGTPTNLGPTVNTSDIDKAPSVSVDGLTHYVSPGQSIQAAINDANDGDEIEVAPGTYNEAINFNGKAVRLYSSGGPDVTTIDANGVADANHVVKCVSSEDANTILEGFTITGGNANGPDPNDKYHPDRRGGGMYNENSSPTVINCTFSGNTSDYYGGGMCNWDSCHPTVTDCTFSGNTSTYGGGMHNGLGAPTLTNCTFSGNTSTYGGGIDNSYSSNPTITNCAFSGNTAIDKGGGMYNSNISSPVLTNCTFNRNSAVGEYGEGGGMYNYISSPTLTNCILWGDTPDEIHNSGQPPTPTVVTYSDVEGGWPGEGNIDTNPLFIDPNGPDNIPGTEDDNLHLLPYSPCIDAGDPTGDYTNQTDMDGQERVLYDNVDIGADEVFPIAGDIDGDGDIDFDDFAYFSGHWLKGK